MGIRFYCPSCDRRLNVKAFLAGKRGICPHCDARFDIPAESELPDGAPKMRPREAVLEAEPSPRASAPTAATATATSAATTTTATHAAPVETEHTDPDPAPPPDTSPMALDPISEAPQAVWYVRPPGGGQYGPARGEVMRGWLDEGRISADSLVWREGWADWRSAGEVFTELGAADHPAPELASDDTPSPRPVKTRLSPHSGSRKSLAAIIILGLLIVALVVVLVIVLMGSGS